MEVDFSSLGAVHEILDDIQFLLGMVGKLPTSVPTTTVAIDLCLGWP